MISAGLWWWDRWFFIVTSTFVVPRHPPVRSLKCNLSILFVNEILFVHSLIKVIGRIAIDSSAFTVWRSRIPPTFLEKKDTE
jgi:hypothetical protein